MSAPLCDFCEEALATHVVLVDLGDRDGEARAGYRVACQQCMDTGYIDPPLITEAWLRWFERPWREPPKVTA